MSFNPKLIDVAIVEQLIQMFKVLEVSCEMVQKHNVEKNSHHLRDGRVSLIRGFLLTFFISAADTDRENLLGPQADHWAERLLQARTRSLLDATPLHYFLNKHLDCDRIQENIKRGDLYALAISATNYNSGRSYLFIQAKKGHPMWKRIRLVTVATKIT